MTVMAVAPGLRDVVTIEGYSFALPPNSDGGAVQAKPAYLETVEYFIDTHAHVDRPMTWSDEVLGIASPDVARKWQLSLQWDQLPRRDYVALQTILSQPGPLDVCLWRPIVETFTCDGVKRIFTLSAMPAVDAFGTSLVTAPPQGYAAYTAQVYKDGVLALPFVFPDDTTPTMGSWPTSPDALGRYQVGIPSTGAVYAKDVVIEVYYVPTFRCRRAGAECTFPVAQRETLGLSLEQLG